MNHLGTIELTTRRLTLRRFTVEDAECMYYNWASDPEVTRFLTWPTHQSVEVSEEVLKQWVESYESKETYQWAIEVNELEQPIGSITVVRSDERTKAAEVGYCIGREYWHKGYTTEALGAVMDFLFAEVGYQRVWSRHDPKNPYSGKVMEACGMKYEGTCRQADWNNTGICDVAIYGKVREVVPEEDAEETEDSKPAQATVTRMLGADGKMKNVISDETMEYVGILAKLELTPQEAESAKKDMEDMLDYIDQLSELDTTGIEPMSHVFPVQNVFREDIVENGDGSEKTLANAPLKKDGGFQVPKTIGE